MYFKNKQYERSFGKRVQNFRKGLNLILVTPKITPQLKKNL